MNYSDFILMFPEFSNIDKYPEATVTAWLNNSAGFVNSERFGGNYNLGIGLLTAHYLFLGTKNGQVPKILDAKTVDGVVGHYNTTSVTFEGAAFYNSSAYGIQFWNLLQLFGAGPMQIQF